MKILCYGDSNTWGSIPGAYDEETGKFQRQAREVLWTNQLAKALPNDEVVVHALCGRTTNLDDETWENRNGYTQLPIALEINAPVEILVMMLGTNDLKAQFERSANDIANALMSLVTLANQTDFTGVPIRNIFLIIPPVLVSTELREEFVGAFDKSQQLPAAIKGLSLPKNVHLIDATQIPISTVDNIHLDEVGHDAMVKLVATKINELKE